MSLLRSFHTPRAKSEFVRRVAPRTIARRRRDSAIEPLVTRPLMAVDLRTFDGTLDDLSHSEWGGSYEALVRTGSADYADGIAAPAGADRPSARAISSALVAETSQHVMNVNLRVQLARSGSAQLATAAQSTSKLTSSLASPLETSH
ncbi:MAG: peroxidase family protein [Candidatus Hydrogenedentales bacterium]